MKKQIITLVAVASIAAGYTMAYAAAGSNGGGIVGSKHDMNVWLGANGGKVDTDLRTCAYCHTPHHANGALEQVTVQVDADPLNDVTYDIYAPLWSRTTQNGNYAQYASATFDPANEGKFYDAMAGPSRLCMTCHDGSIAADAYYGQTGTAALTRGDDNMNYFGSGSFAVGQSFGLMNDHPVGFEYDDMQDNVKYELKLSSSTFAGSTKKISDSLTDVNGMGIMTCASCHDVHNGKDVKNTAPASGRGYFLLAPQANAALCLSCHDKNS
jgi:Zn-finger protein